MNYVRTAEGTNETVRVYDTGQLARLTKHCPDCSGLNGNPDIKAYDTTGKHRPQTETAIHFTVGKKLGQAVFIGDPSVLFGFRN